MLHIKKHKRQKMPKKKRLIFSNFKYVFQIINMNQNNELLFEKKKRKSVAIV